MPRKTDSNNPADWDSELVQEAQPLAEALGEAYFSQRYPGFDLEDDDWPDLREKLGKVENLLRAVGTRLRAR